MCVCSAAPAFRCARLTLTKFCSARSHGQFTSSLSFSTSVIASRLQSHVYFGKSGSRNERLEVILGNDVDSDSSTTTPPLSLISSRQIIKAKISFDPAKLPTHINEIKLKVLLSTIITGPTLPTPTDWFVPQHYEHLLTFLTIGSSPKTAALLTLGTDEENGLGPTIFVDTTKLLASSSFSGFNYDQTRTISTIIPLDCLSAELRLTATTPTSKSTSTSTSISTSTVRGGTSRPKGFLSKSNSKSKSSFSTNDVPAITLSNLNLMNVEGIHGESLVHRLLAFVTDIKSAKVVCKVSIPTTLLFSQAAECY